MASDWDFFEKIYCISLIERKDRRQQALGQFARVGLAERVEFVIVARHPTNCEQGCYESHMRCMKMGLQAGAARILIFEDDIVFDRFSPAVLRGCIDFLAHDPDWHMLFLGCMVKSSRRTSYPAVAKIRYRSLTHAYAVHQRCARGLTELPWQGVPYDDFLRDRKDDRCYAAYPSFAFQSNSRSDNVRYLPLDRWRRLLGGLRRLQKSNEFFHRHRSFIIAAHALALLLILLAF
ncbi:MAG: glycosyltransferase [Desulfobacteraceae bacterium]|nr:MAG: glycosyltransferase [Desulfobacteraceae bacterium]